MKKMFATTKKTIITVYVIVLFFFFIRALGELKPILADFT